MDSALLNMGGIMTDRQKVNGQLQRFCNITDNCAFHFIGREIVALNQRRMKSHQNLGIGQSITRYVISINVEELCLHLVFKRIA